VLRGQFPPGIALSAVRPAGTPRLWPHLLLRVRRELDQWIRRRIRAIQLKHGADGKLLQGALNLQWANQSGILRSLDPNFSNRLVRTRMPDDVAGEEGQLSHPCRSGCFAARAVVCCRGLRRADLPRVRPRRASDANLRGIWVVSCHPLARSREQEVAIGAQKSGIELQFEKRAR
jgi:hypothetical protein